MVFGCMAWAWDSGESRKFATAMAPSLCAALVGMATKLVLPMVPFSSTKVRTLSGRMPLPMAVEASLGLKEIMMSISPSARSWRMAGPVSGNCSPLRHRVGLSCSYQRQSGAVTGMKVASVAGDSSTCGSSASSCRACFRKVEPRKLRIRGCVMRPGLRRAQSSIAGIERGGFCKRAES